MEGIRPKGWKRELVKSLEKEGYQVLSRGWPEFLLESGGKITFMKILRGGGNLSRKQKTMRACLERLAPYKTREV